ncbi:MAG: hypothetical protein IT364_19110 [Candidatus Hydrogenedentes bacterium]|nr:hypothetical protein [Candidatus Hydrogenedentota bacterium]
MSADSLDKAIAAILERSEPIDYEGLLRWPNPPSSSPAAARIYKTFKLCKRIAAPPPDASQDDPEEPQDIEEWLSQSEAQMVEMNVQLARMKAKMDEMKAEIQDMLAGNLEEKHSKNWIPSVDTHSLSSEPPITGRLDYSQADASEEEWLAAKEYLDKYRVPLRNLIRVEDVADWRVFLKPRGYFQRASALHTSLYSAVKLLCLAAVYHSLREREDDWDRYLLAAIRLTLSASSIQLAMSHLVYCGGVAQVTRALEFVLGRSWPPTEALAQLEAGLRSLDDEELLARTYVTERVFMLEERRRKTKSGLRGSGWWRHMPGKRSAAFYLEQMTGLIRVANRPPNERTPAFLDAYKHVQSGKKFSSTRSSIETLIAPCAFANQLALVRVRLARAALAIRANESRDGDCPIPQELLPRDPFDDAPVRHRQIDGGFMVYSVGWDGVDSGGSEDAMDKSWWPPGLAPIGRIAKDIVFKIALGAGKLPTLTGQSFP